MHLVAGEAGWEKEKNMRVTLARGIFFLAVLLFIITVVSVIADDYEKPGQERMCLNALNIPAIVGKNKSEADSYLIEIGCLPKNELFRGALDNGNAVYGGNNIVAVKVDNRGVPAGTPISGGIWNTYYRLPRGKNALFVQYNGASMVAFNATLVDGELFNKVKNSVLIN